MTCDNKNFSDLDHHHLLIDMPSYNEIIAMAKANTERGEQHLKDLQRRREEENDKKMKFNEKKEKERKQAELEISKRRKEAEVKRQEIEKRRLEERKKQRDQSQGFHLNNQKAAPKSKPSSSTPRRARSPEVLTREDKRRLKQLKDFGEDVSKKSLTSLNRKSNSKSNTKKQPDLIALNTNKRDRRTVDEIQTDLKMKKATNTPNSNKTTNKPVQSKKSISDRSNNDKLKSSKKRHQESNLSEESESESVSDDEDDEENLHGFRSSDIWSIFGKDKSKYLSRDINSDEEDMEATNDDVLEEELKSSRLGRKEDDRELAELKRHEIEKKKRKLN